MVISACFPWYIGLIASWVEELNIRVCDSLHSVDIMPSHNREPSRDRRRTVGKKVAMSSVLSNTLSRSNIVELGHRGSESGQPPGSRTTTSSIGASPWVHVLSHSAFIMPCFSLQYMAMPCNYVIWIAS